MILQQVMDIAGPSGTALGGDRYSSEVPQPWNPHLDRMNAYQMLTSGMKLVFPGKCYEDRSTPTLRILKRRIDGSRPGGRLLAGIELLTFLKRRLGQKTSRVNIAEEDDDCATRNFTFMDRQRWRGLSRNCHYREISQATGAGRGRQRRLSRPPKPPNNRTIRTDGQRVEWPQPLPFMVGGRRGLSPNRRQSLDFGKLAGSP